MEVKKGGVGGEEKGRGGWKGGVGGGKMRVIIEKNWETIEEERSEMEGKGGCKMLLNPWELRLGYGRSLPLQSITSL